MDLKERIIAYMRTEAYKPLLAEDLAEEMGFHFFVVTGGTLARQTVKKIKPKMVLAVACERDLTSAIQDIYPLPAVGIMNIRPNGPCYNTHVDIELVRQEIENVLDRKEE